MISLADRLEIKASFIIRFMDPFVDIFTNFLLLSIILA